MIPKFAIFYADGSIVEGGGEDDEEVTITFKVSKKWLEAPNDGVQAVVVENPYSCRYIWRDNDYYYMLPNGNEVCSTDDIGGYLREHLQGLMKFGLCVTREQWEEICKTVYAYEGIPRNCENRKPRPENIFLKEGL